MTAGCSEHHKRSINPYPEPVEVAVARLEASKEDVPKVELRDYIEALFREKERALDMAGDERERAAAVLREEQRRALEAAEKEREKAAAALRASIIENYTRLREHFDALLSEKDRASSVAGTEREKAAQALQTAMVRTIDEGDDRLREHITNQITQITSALRSAELLETERINAVKKEVLSARQEFTLVHEASERAVQKAESAQSTVNATQNEFRGALTDLSALMMPRKEAEQVKAEQERVNLEFREALAAMRTQLAVGPPSLGSLQTQVNKQADTESGRKAGVSTATAIIVTGAFLMLGIIGTILTIIGMN